MAKVTDFRARWHTYYSEKRIVHQWRQVDLLKGLPVNRVLEVGPYLGLVTAMFASAGYQVTTLDMEAASQGIGASAHIQADITAVPPEQLAGHDVAVCCEILEHIDWNQVDGALERLIASGIPWLILSVPYEGFQFGFSLYLNRFEVRLASFLRKLRFLKTFKIKGDSSDWEPHKWEIGYRGYPLKALRRKVEAAGYSIEQQTFTSGCRSVFLVCRNRAAQALAST
ncbi:MAG: hypothetical protein HOK61_06515 [Alphaproteobacteria bacterium]|jgi:hypothetical protein|nr:hypothetical protein [Alphaproteobacteria bacterium]